MLSNVLPYSLQGLHLCVSNNPCFSFTISESKIGDLKSCGVVGLNPELAQVPYVPYKEIKSCVVMEDFDFPVGAPYTGFRLSCAKSIILFQILRDLEWFLSSLTTCYTIGEFLPCVVYTRAVQEFVARSLYSCGPDLLLEPIMAL